MERTSRILRPIIRRLQVQPRTIVPARLGLSARVRLVLQILLAYIELLPLVRRNDLRLMVSEARAAHVPAAPVSDDYDPVFLALRLASVVQKVLSPLPLDKRCLIKSLVVLRVLTNHNLESRLVVGVRTGPGGPLAHAWVTHAGVPVLPPEGFTSLIEL